MELAPDAEGNKYLNFDESSQYDNNRNGNRLIDYEILQFLSEEKEDDQNNFNFVAKVRSLNNQKIYSMKKIDLSQCFNNDIKKRVEEIMPILKGLNNPHIIKYYNYFIEDNNLYVVMEFMNNSDIRGFIQAHQILNEAISEEEIWNILLQCLTALNYLHNQVSGNAGLKLTNIFMNNEQNAKIGVFHDLNCNNSIINPREDIYLLGKFFYIMMNSENINSKQIKDESYISQLEYDKINNNKYSNELKEIVNSMSIYNKSNVTVVSLYSTVKEEYVKKYAKNTSIEAVLRCLASYKKLFDIISAQKSLFNSNKTKYYINYWFQQAMEAVFGLKEKLLTECIEEFRRAIASSYSKLDGNKEIDPLLLLTFLLFMLHKETNKVEKDQTKLNGENNEKNKKYVISSIFDGEEEDKTNKMQMWNKYINEFNATVNSPISDLFFGFVKRKILCQTCRTGYYSFYHYLYIIFDLSNRSSDLDFNLIEDGFKAKHNNYQVINEDGSNKISCERCLTYQSFKEFNRYYMLKDQLIICFIRGNNYKNKSKIIFDEKLNLKDYIEPDINSPQNFYLVGSIIKSNNGQFVSYSRNAYNEYYWHCPNGRQVTDVENKNYSPIKDIQKEEENGQIIMLFYNNQETKSYNDNMI
jgi:serine/threonine protein kinase